MNYEETPAQADSASKISSCTISSALKLCLSLWGEQKKKPQQPHSELSHLVTSRTTSNKGLNSFFLTAKSKGCSEQKASLVYILHICIRSLAYVVFVCICLWFFYINGWKKCSKEAKKNTCVPAIMNTPFTTCLGLSHTVL